ncbi:MAG TPA: chemotaxis response regulator protein-glutamate methylesterase [Candidatus Limnocylindria bacterium]|nr:chemotaxis response regulator protein-glutamate methylesterase [Candidatus Limnocylindria bacterium]
MRARPIRVLIVDDSATVRKVVSDSLSGHPDIEVIGTAVDPYVARDKILALNPDVLTLDIEMPRMDGLTFLRLLMKHRPMPVIVMSSLTKESSHKALEALQAGAVDVFDKPGGSLSAHSDGIRLADKIRAAAGARIRVGAPPPPAPVSPRLVRPYREPVPAGMVRPADRHPERNPEREGERPIAPASSGRRYLPRQLIVIGASTGGTEALKQVLTRLPTDLPGICVVQHIPAHFSTAFANRLNELCELEVREAVTGDRVEPGRVLIAPGGHHLLLRWNATHYTAHLTDGPMLHHQRPAVDVLFDSAAKSGSAPTTLAILLTGMGADGAAGMLTLREGGATTWAQDEESCVVFGMPREALLRGAAQKALALDQIATAIDRYADSVAL